MGKKHMIDIALISLKKLLNLLLDTRINPWLAECEIIPDYLPPYATEDIKPSVAIRYNGFETDHPPCLRYSKGPSQGFYWDLCGEDFLTIELAILALSKAPAPRGCCPIEVPCDWSGWGKTDA
jgi:hypothetical protein